jgi:N6-adenosine-specific RNA methylase IME4
MGDKRDVVRRASSHERLGLHLSLLPDLVKPGLGLGSSHLRNNTEHLLLGSKGRHRSCTGVSRLGCMPRGQDHSHKSEEQYAIIERRSPGLYLVLFARGKRPGWNARQRGR